MTIDYWPFNPRIPQVIDQGPIDKRSEPNSRLPHIQFNQSVAIETRISFAFLKGLIDNLLLCLVAIDRLFLFVWSIAVWYDEVPPDVMYVVYLLRAVNRQPWFPRDGLVETDQSQSRTSV